jgi:hypothetical protein
LKLRKFLEKVGNLVTDDELLAERITEDMLLKYDAEIKNPKSAFKMNKKDFEFPLERIELLTIAKHLDKVDSRKMQRVEDLIFLLSLYSYKNKYETTEFDSEIKLVELKIEAQPVLEVEELMNVEVATRGTWSN